MNSYERIYSRLVGEKTDKIPNLCILMGFAAKQYGIAYSKYVYDYRLLVDANMGCCEKYGIDLLCAISDPVREAEGFGAETIMPEDGVPYLKEPFLKSLSDITKLMIIKPENGRRMNDRIEAVGLFREKAGMDYSVCGWIEGALAEACVLRGISNFLMDLIEDPDGAAELMDICAGQAAAFAMAQIDAGADMIGIGDAAASLIGPLLYEEFALPYEKRIIDAIHAAGAKVKLHICGNITSIVPLISKTGADIVDCDWMVDFGSAIDIFGDKCAASGNFDPVAVLLQGNEKTVESAVKQCASLAGANTMLAAGCEVPVHTPPENLLAVARTIEKLAF